MKSACILLFAPFLALAFPIANNAPSLDADRPLFELDKRAQSAHSAIDRRDGAIERRLDDSSPNFRSFLPRAIGGNRNSRRDNTGGNTGGNAGGGAGALVGDVVGLAGDAGALVGDVGDLAGDVVGTAGDLVGTAGDLVGAAGDVIGGAGDAIGGVGDAIGNIVGGNNGN